MPTTNIGIAMNERILLPQNLKKTYKATTTWTTRPSKCLNHNSLSSIEYAVIVSGPPRCRSRNGAQNAWMELFAVSELSPDESPWLLARLPSATVATTSADRHVSDAGKATR
ncbi:hypothetical protein NC652_035360 [Populus alba x Populus x berolinensis]|nr:hypothetical protein NC652_035360 [Populus alba x Populus x berolinensis]